MSWTLRRICVFVFAVALLRVDAFSQEKKTITSGAEIDFNSSFTWRDMVLDERPVFENSIWLDLYGFDLTVWANTALPSAVDRSRLRSSGLTVSYHRDWKNLTLEPAIEVYRWPEDPGSTHTIECSMRLEYHTGFVHIFTEHVVDVIANKGGYFAEGGFRFEKRAGKTTGALELASGFASTKFNDFNIDVAKPALILVRAEIAVTRNLNQHFYIRPHVDFIHVPDRQIRENLGIRNINTIGLAVGFKF